MAPASIPSSPSIPSDQGAVLATELDRLGFGQVAEVFHFQLAVGVLRREPSMTRIVSLSRALELGDGFLAWKSGG